MIELKQVVAKIINKYDPMHLKAVSPKEVYMYEVYEISEYLRKQKYNVTSAKLENKIRHVFDKNFDEDVAEAEEITNEIMQYIQNADNSSDAN